MIIGITGPTGAGKDTAAAYLQRILNARHVSGGDVLRKMLEAAGLEPKKTAIGDFGTCVRTHYGVDAILKKVLEQADPDSHVINSGFRSPMEAQLIKEKGGMILYVDAPSVVRHERVIARARSHESFTVVDLQKLDEQEFSSKDPMAENLKSVKLLADEVVMNDGNLNDLYGKLDQFAQKFALNS